MAQEEKYGTRDLAYSAWHRRLSMQRFVGIEKAQTLAMIDADVSVWVEYDDETKEPLLLIETAQDVGQAHKCATVTKRLARKAKMPAFVVLYTKSDEDNPAMPGVKDIKAFRVKRVFPEPESLFHRTTPEGWARHLVKLREQEAFKIDVAIEECGIQWTGTVKQENAAW